MISLNWLPETAYFFILIFARVGSMLMLIPALGEATIPARMRLTFALALSLVLYPWSRRACRRCLPTLLRRIVIVLHEIAIGLMIGAIARLVGHGRAGRRRRHRLIGRPLAGAGGRSDQWRRCRAP